MRHCHGTALGNLFTEQWDHGAVRTQHVAEAGRNELRHAFHIALLDRLVEALHVNLADTFRATHHVRRIHRLVRGDHHEFPRAILHGQVGDHTGTVHVVTHTLARIILHHRNMLISRRMEYIGGAMLREDLLHARLVSDVRHQGIGVDIPPIPRHHQADVVQGSFRLIYQDQAIRSERGDLAHHLATDAAGGSRYQDALTTKQAAHRLHVYLYLFPGKQILDLNLPELCMRQIAPAIPFLRRRGHVDLDPRLRQTGHHIRLFPNGVALQGGDEKDRRPLPAHGIDQLLIERVHTHSHQYTILHVPGLRDEACQHVLCGILVLDALRQTDTALLHAEDKGTFSLRLAKGRHVEILHEHTHRPHQAHRQQGG